MKDYYNILGVQPNASEDEIRSAYKKLAMKHHPDRGGNQTEFQNIQEAYSTLTDPNRRAEWEQQRAFGQGGGQNFGFSFNFGPDINDILHQFHGGHHFFGQGFQRQARNRDLRTIIELDLATTLDAQTKFVEIRDQTGSVRTVQVNVPRGVQSNMQMRFPGHGDHTNKQISPGDLYVEFRIKPHPDFKVDGINLHRQVKVNAIDAMLGVNFAIQGLDGRHFDLRIPASTQPGAVMSMGQQGLWDINTPRRGDLLVEVTIEIPKSITSNQLERLKAIQN